MTWTPHLGSQTEFLRRSEFEVLFGGSAGPGKTDCLVAAIAADISHPKYRGLLVRRTFPQLQEVIDRCWRHYPQAGGTFRATEKRWEFPSGAVIDLGHMQHEADKYNYQGKEYHRAGIDELTQFTETQYTYLLSRLRSTEPELVPQAVSTTNPGGIGHYWVKERFVTITDHGRTYIDPKTGLSRVFVPAKIEDNPTLFLNDPAYLARLEALPEIERMRLRHGIWDAFEGQVFTELSHRVHGCEDFDIPPEWERFCCFDWGYAKPFSVGWYAMDYDGVLYRYREWYGCKKEAEGLTDGADVGLKMQAWEVARGILEREKGEKIRMRIADPAIFHPHPESRKREARGVTVHEDMGNEGVYFLKADNDRTHGKMQVHKRLKFEITSDPETGEVTDERPMLKVFNSCKGFWRTLPQMREDPKNPEDVDSDQEDHCLHGETLVVTREGQRTIRSMVGTTGEVLTVGGQWTRYWDCRMTRANAEVVRLRFEDGRELVCTPDHKLLTFDGLWLEARDFVDELGYDSVPCESRSSVEPFRSSTASGITSAVGISSAKAAGCISSFGASIAAKFRKAVTSTIRTTTALTTRLAIWSCEIGKTISLTMRNAMTIRNGLQPCTMVLASGTGAAKERNGTASISRKTFGLYSLGRSQRLVLNAAIPSLLHTPFETKRSSAQDVARPARCVSVEPAGRADVYCLIADETHCFAVEGGLIVHNCYDEFRYMCMARPIKPKHVERIPPGSFMAERNKLLRARKYAQRHGVPVDVAYGRVH